VNRRIRLLYHLQRNFFVIDEIERVRWFEALRYNTLVLVKQGFTREEVFYMPLTEVMDYIKILNDQNEREMEEINNYNNKEQSSESSINDIKMLGNTY
jgi:hypothetical protein